VRVLQSQDIQLVRHGEDNVELASVEEFALAGCEPALAGLGLTLGAVPISTRVVGDGLITATLASIAMPAEGECLAVHSRGSAVGFAAFVGIGQNILSDTPCRTAHGNESWAMPSLSRATPSATSEP
jgi:hypothetical protein